MSDSQPVHARWCAIHEEHYRGAVCPLCRRRQRRVSRQQHARLTSPRTLLRPDRVLLREARQARRWSAQELAREARISTTRVHELEQEPQRRITLQTAQRLATALGITVAALTRDTADE